MDTGTAWCLGIFEMTSIQLFLQILLLLRGFWMFKNLKVSLTSSSVVSLLLKIKYLLCCATWFMTNGSNDVLQSYHCWVFPNVEISTKTGGTLCFNWILSSSKDIWIVLYLLYLMQHFILFIVIMLGMYWSQIWIYMYQVIVQCIVQCSLVWNLHQDYQESLALQIRIKTFVPRNTSFALTLTCKSTAKDHSRPLNPLEKSQCDLQEIIDCWKKIKCDMKHVGFLQCCDSFISFMSESVQHIQSNRAGQVSWTHGKIGSEIHLHQIHFSCLLL